MIPLPHATLRAIQKFTTGHDPYEGLPESLIPPDQSKLYAACRPDTGLYAALLVWLGCRTTRTPFDSGYIILAITFMCMTWSIQLFNDFIDRHHDIQKGKTLAHEKPLHVAGAAGKLGGYTLLLLWLAGAELQSWPVNVFAGAIFALGILYSFLRRAVVLQNLVVAGCAMSPLLCSSIVTATTTARNLWLCAIVLALVLGREIIKDVEDKKYDESGWKKTIPVVWGIAVAQTVIVGLLGICAVLIAASPDSPSIGLSGLLFIPCLLGAVYPKIGWQKIRWCLDFAGISFLVVLLTAL